MVNKTTFMLRFKIMFKMVTTHVRIPHMPAYKHLQPHHLIIPACHQLHRTGSGVYGLFIQV
jgi:hypothetical protein